MLSQENATITAVAFGGSLAQNFTLGGSAVVNSIDDTVTTTVTNASLGGGSVLISASNTSTIQTGAGNVEIATGSGGSNSASVGASIVVDSITNTTTTTVTDAPMNARRHGAGARRFQRIHDRSGGGRPTRDHVRAGRLCRCQHLDDQHIGQHLRHSLGQGDGGVTVSATDTSTITAGTGTVDIARAGSAVCAAVSLNTVSSTVNADINRSMVDGGSGVSVIAQSTQTVFAAAIGVGGRSTLRPMGSGSRLV